MNTKKTLILSAVITILFVTGSNLIQPSSGDSLAKNQTVSDTKVTRCLDYPLCRDQNL